MSDTDVDPSTTPPPDDDAGGGGGPPPPPDPSGGRAGGGPPGGGPILAALARARGQHPVSAPGPGNVAQGLMLLKSAVDVIQKALPSLMPGSQQHRDALKAVQSLSRHLPQGAPTAGVQITQLMDLLRNTKRNALMQQVMSQRGAGGGAGGGGQPQPGPGPDQQPPPSTPMPGA